MAGLTLLAIVISSYLFYYLYDSTAEPSLGKEAKEQEFLAFAAEQDAQISATIKQQILGISERLAIGDEHG